MSKQDRQGARTVSELARRYNFDKSFAEVLGIAKDAQDIALKAAEAVAKFDPNLTADEIFDLLTNGGTEQGIYREGDKIYLNANFIKTGFISSDLIKAGVIRSLDYEVVEVDEYYPSATLYPAVRLYPNDGKDITKGMEIDFGAGVIRIGGNAGKATPRNLLDNSDFSHPVNQRGQASYIATSGYTIDRWRTTNKLDVSVANGYINLTCTSTTGANGFSQLMEILPEVGTPLTLAVMEADGTLHVGSVKMPSSDYVTAFSSDRIAGRVNTGGVAIMISMGKTANLKWVALYEGEYTAETLPDYQSKGYGAELAECQRYFLQLDGTKIASGYSNASSTLVVALPIPTTMRITSPSLTISGNVSILLGGTQYGSFTVVDGSNTATGGVLRFRISRESATEIPSSHPFGAYWTGNTQISADL